LRVAVLVEGIGLYRYMDSLVVFVSADFESAFEAALQLGRRLEREFLNENGQRVRYRLKQIISLDLIRADSLDGAEVYSEPVWLQPEDAEPFDTSFEPEASEPTQTI
jgi:hypothetical protein